MDSETYWVLGDKVRILADGDLTGGRYAMVEVTAPPGSGPPPHIHSREDELFMVISGKLTITAEGEEHEIGPGESLFAPRKGAHFYRNPGPDRCTFIVVISPAGFEDYFRQIGREVRPGELSAPLVSPNDIAMAMELAPSFGLAFVE